LQKLHNVISPECKPYDPKVGDIVCTCAWKHKKVIKRKGDDLFLEDGEICSLSSCGIEPADHEWSHPGEESQEELFYQTAVLLERLTYNLTEEEVQDKLTEVRAKNGWS
jgi:hypothetical protein